MRVIIFGWILSLGLAVSAAETCPDKKIKNDGGVPWPWSVECPLSVDKLEGFWQTELASEVKSSASIYEITKVGTRPSGDENLVVIEYVNDVLVARGFGISRKDQMGVKAAMRPQKEGGEGHWLFISSFADESGVRIKNQAPSCKHNQVFTAVKKVAFNKSEYELVKPLIIKKLD